MPGRRPGQVRDDFSGEPFASGDGMNFEPVTPDSSQREPMPESTYPKAPVRGPLPPSVEQAARTIHREVWGEPYKPGKGPMHFAGGPYWGKELRRLADRWVRLAAAAHIAAEWLPDEDCDLVAPREKEQG